MRLIPQTTGKWLAGVSLFILSGACGDTSEIATARYEVIPQPRQTEQYAGEPFILRSSTRICYPAGNEKMKQIAGFLARYVSEITGYEPKITENSTASGNILLKLGDADTFSPEGYRLTVQKDHITLTGGSEAGVFYGIQTLRKSLPTEAHRPFPADTSKTQSAPTLGPIACPPVAITDYPRFHYRGMHLDVGRHFFSTDFIKQYIDLLALHHFNTFHWHLTEDQGWRIEIKKYPRLTEIGSLRKESLRNDGSGEFDGKPYGGFYTQADVREIIRYAAERYITVIPEIDLPGHITSALAAYPELGCTGGPYEVATTYGVHQEVLCVGNEQSLRFAEDVLSEIIDLFPSHYIHVGGDECPRDRWEKCPRCQALIRQNGWTDTPDHRAEDKLQSYFMTQIEQFVNRKGRQMIGWDEILEGGLAPNATVMSWRGMENGIQAAQAQHDVIMTPAGYAYFSNRQLLELGGNRGIRRVYEFEPVPDTLSPETGKHIIGVQGCLWSERIETPERAEYLLLPRMSALSEVAWSDPRQKAFEPFLDRLYRLIALYDRNGYTYSRHAFGITETLEVDSVNQALQVSFSTLGNRPIYYTSDGTLPDTTAALYTAPFRIDRDTRLTARVIEPGNEEDEEIFSETIRVNQATFKPARLARPPHENYTFQGVSTLTDGLNGGTNYNTGGWLGFLTDMDMTVDLQKPTTVSSVSITTNVSKGAAVMDATGLEVWGSDNGQDFRRLAADTYPVLGKEAKDGIYTHALDFTGTPVRYLRIVAKVTPELPAWHTWPGNPAFLFVDEVCVN